MLPILNARGMYADDRIMKRVGGRLVGETFWCHVTGRTLNRAQPHEAGIWTFEDLSSRRPVTAELTARERDVLTLIAKGYAVARVADLLGITYNTAAGYVKAVYRKLNVSSRAEAALEASRRGLVV